MTTAVQLAQSVAPGTSLGFKNRIINGAMTIDQRNAGASVTATSDTYCVDRWAVGYGAPANAFTAQRSTTAPVGFYNSLKLTAGTGASSGTGAYAYLRQGIEGFNIADLNWGTANAKAVTVSFNVYSSLTGTFGFVIRDTPGNYCFASTYTISSANTWTTASIKIPGPTSGTFTIGNGNGADIFFDVGCGTDYSPAASSSWQSFTNALGVSGATKLTETTGATLYITGVQLEVGTAATSFEYRDYGRELIMCQRYYQKTYNQDMVPGYSGGYANGAYRGSTYVARNPINTAYSTWFFKVTMRTNPTLTFYAPANGDAGYMTSSSTNVAAGTDTTMGSDSSAMMYSTTTVPAIDNYFHATASAEL